MQYSLRFPFAASVIFAASLLILAPHRSFAAQITVTMTDYQFNPKSVTVNVGDTVTFINSGAMPHTATADNGSFDSGTVQPGQSFNTVFNQAGTFQYHCKFHGGSGGTGMSGTITVVTQSTVAPPPSPVNSNVTTGTSGATAIQLQTQANALLQQVQALQQYYATPPATSVNTGSGTGAACPQLGRSLSVGSTGTDVTQLQTFLAADPSVYPEGKVTGYYGALTQAAVQRFQVKNNVVSSGTPSTTGYGRVGPKTIAAIALACSSGAGGGSAGGPLSSDLGAVMAVTPISGAAPLRSTFQVTVNTTNSCIAAMYLLDFGDGTNQPIPSVAGVCQPQSITVAHVYQYGGSYHVTLSSGAHQTYTSISVTGMTAPVPAGSDTRPKAAVQIADYTFTPATLTIDPGTIVTWTNAGVVPHTVVSDNGTTFNSGEIQPGQVYSVEFDQPGTYPYYDSYHGAPGSGQIGSVTVNAVTTQTNTAAATTNSTSQQSSSYGPLTLTTPGSLQAVATFNTAGSCDTYSIDWGDGSNPVFRPSGFASCTTGENVTLSHTYHATGTYTVTLDRGAGLYDEVTAQATVTN